MLFLTEGLDSKRCLQSTLTVLATYGNSQTVWALRRQFRGDQALA